MIGIRKEESRQYVLKKMQRSSPRNHYLLKNVTSALTSRQKRMNLLRGLLMMTSKFHFENNQLYLK